MRTCILSRSHGNLSAKQEQKLKKKKKEERKKKEKTENKILFGKQENQREKT